MASKRKKTQQVTTNFKQKPKKRATSGAKSAGRAPRAASAGRTGDFDPEQNVRRIDEAEAPAEAAAEMPATSDMASDDKFAQTGRSIPRFPEEG